MLEWLLRELREILFEDASTERIPEDEGHWVTIHGHPVFLRGKATEKLVPPDIPKERRIEKIVTYVGKDGVERKRTIYTEEWKKAASDYKFARVSVLTSQADKIDRGLRKDLQKEKGTTLRKAAGVASLLMHLTGMRVGEGDKPGETEGEDTFGTTSLQKKHVTLDGDRIRLQFRGKSGVDQDIRVEDSDLADGLRLFMGGKDREDSADPLFQYEAADGKKKVLDRRDVSKRVKEINEHFKPKDFRTHVAMRVASRICTRLVASLKGKPVPEKERDKKSLVKRVMHSIGTAVAKKLGNTPGVALNEYTDPYLVEQTLKKIGLEAPKKKSKKKSGSTEQT